MLGTGVLTGYYPTRMHAVNVLLTTMLEYDHYFFFGHIFNENSTRQNNECLTWLTLLVFVNILYAYSDFFAATCFKQVGTGAQKTGEVVQC